MNFIRRLFMRSRFSEEMRAQLTAEGIVLIDEGRPASITWRHYRAPGRRFGYRKMGTRGGVAVTGERLVVWAAGHPRIDVPLRHPLIRALEPSVDDSGRLVIAFDAHAFNDKASGRVELRVRTEQAQRILDLVNEAAAAVAA